MLNSNVAFVATETLQPKTLYIVFRRWQKEIIMALMAMAMLCSYSAKIITKNILGSIIGYIQYCVTEKNRSYSDI